MKEPDRDRGESQWTGYFFSGQKRKHPSIGAAYVSFMTPTSSKNLALLIIRLAYISVAAVVSGRGERRSAPGSLGLTAVIAAGGRRTVAEVGVVTLVVLEGLVSLDEVHGVVVGRDEHNQGNEGQEGEGDDGLLVHFFLLDCWRESQAFF